MIPRPTLYERALTVPEITSEIVTVKNINDIRALIIGDFHLGKYHNIMEDIDTEFKKLYNLIYKERPNIIFILGDLIHAKPQHDNMRIWNEVYNRLESFKIETHIIPGNHERHMKTFNNFKRSGPNVFLHNTDVLQLYAGDQIFVLFGHDLQNDWKVHGAEKIEFWIKTLKQSYKSVLPEDQLLILGHVHQHVNVDNGLVQTLHVFSASQNTYFYGIMTAKDGKPELKYDYFLKDINKKNDHKKWAAYTPKQN